MIGPPVPARTSRATPQAPVRRTARWFPWLAAAGALVLLNASLTFRNVWPTPKIRWDWALSAELAVAVLLLALAARWSAPLARRLLPAAWVLLVAGRYLAVTGPGLYGREFNLYWDAPHLSNVAAMLARAAPWWLLVATALGAIGAVAGASLAARLAFGTLAAAMARPAVRRTLVLASIAVLAVFARQQASPSFPVQVKYADPVTPAYARQARFIAAAFGPGHRSVRLAPPPRALAASLDGLDRADVLLAFVESYGAITFDDPALAAALAPSRADLDAAIADTGRGVVSAFVRPPTFGASSWLSHLSLIAGIEVADQYAYVALMAERRETLVTTFARQGYRTVALMPGLRQPWPEGAFYGFDVIYGRADLEYPGPQFGWWGIPDQYALARLDALEGRRRSDRAPLFVVFPTSTAHAPFGPVPPYLPDWARILRPDGFDPGEVAAALAARPDLTNLAPSYARATAYELTTFAGYLREHPDDDHVLILIGDHQPPAAVSGSDAPWDVPIHVIARNRRVLARLVGHGFEPGLFPQRPVLGPMHALVRPLLDAFEAPDGEETTYRERPKRQPAAADGERQQAADHGGP